VTFFARDLNPLISTFFSFTLHALSELSHELQARV